MTVSIYNMMGQKLYAVLYVVFSCFPLLHAWLNSVDLTLRESGHSGIHSHDSRHGGIRMGVPDDLCDNGKVGPTNWVIFIEEISIKCMTLVIYNIVLFIHKACCMIESKLTCMVHLSDKKLRKH